MTGRSTDEWIGKDADTPPPPRVRVRVFERYGGKCYLSGRKIMAGDKWEIEHIVALINGGQNREKNLAPALADKHKEKTREDMALKSKIARVQKKHLGLKPKTSFGNPRFKRKLDGTVVERK